MCIKAILVCLRKGLRNLWPKNADADTLGEAALEGGSNVVNDMIDRTSNLANDAWDCANDVIGCASDTATNIGNTVADGASNILESASDAFNFWLG